MLSAATVKRLCGAPVELVYEVSGRDGAVAKQCLYVYNYFTIYAINIVANATVPCKAAGWQ